MQFSVSVKAVDQILVAGHRAFADRPRRSMVPIVGTLAQMRFDRRNVTLGTPEKRLTCYEIYHYSACWGDCFLLAGGLGSRSVVDVAE